MDAIKLLEIRFRSIQCFTLIGALLFSGGITFAQDNRILTFEEAKQLADQGDAYGEAIAAFHYSVGWQTEKDSALAAKYAALSTQKGHPLGAFRLGSLLRSGEGVPKNESQGLQLQQSALEGLDAMPENPYALTALGVMLFQGKVVKGDKPLAAELYRKAADMGFAPAQFNFAMCAAAGNGIPKSGELKIEYLEKSNALSYPPAINEVNKERIARKNKDIPSQLKEADQIAGLAFKLQEENKLPEALAHFMRSKNIIEDALGPNHPVLVIGLNQIAACYSSAGDYANALPLLERSLAIRNKALGAEHPDTISSMMDLATIYSDLGDYSNSLSLNKRALAIAEKVHGPEHPETAMVINNLASNYQNMAEYTQALSFSKQALAMFEKIYGLEHKATAKSLMNLANVYSYMGDYDKAISTEERALVIFEQVYGPEHPETVSLISNLATNFRSSGDYARALSFNERALAIREKVLGREHPETADSFNNLAVVYNVMGNYAKALKLFERASAIQEKALGPTHPNTVSSLNNLALSYQYISDYDKAISIGEKALNIREKVLGPEHPDTLSSVETLALLYGDFGDYSKAQLLNQRALTIREKVLGSQHPDTASSHNHIAINLLDMGYFAEAIAHYESASAIWEKTLGPEHPNTLSSIGNLAACYSKMEDHAKALPFNERVLAIREKVLGLEHPDTASALSNLAINYSELGDNAKALTLNKRALAIEEKVYGFEHSGTASCLDNLSQLTYRMGDLEASRDYAERFISIKQRELPLILAFDERTRLAWQKKNLSFAAACILPPDSLSRLVFSQKGIVLDSLAEDRALALDAGSSVEGASILQKIKSLQGSLSKIAFEQGKETDAAEIQDELGKLQREMTTKLLGRDRQRASAILEITAILPALSGGGILLDFIQFEDPKLKGDEAVCLGAIITGEDNKPLFVRIDGGTTINRAIDTLRTAINQGNSIEVEAQTKFLSEKLWSPIAAKIPEGTKRLFLCPDANLNFLSFAALLESDGRFVAEKYPITYIGSARDLAKKPSSEISKSIALIANPQFDATAQNAKTTDLLAMRSAEADVFGSIALPPLPGTEAEASSLQALASEKGWQTKSYLGSDATETSVRNTKKPGVLHLATHGFYLNSFTPPGPEGSRGMSVVGVKETAEDKKKKDKGVDPMRASGVAFTGAQQTLTSWSQKKAPNPETDGVLTAEEVGALRLDGTWLVTLSACETGVGEARSGEGVFGLRRAFMIAGAENLLMTLWPVADETTAKIMTDFYKEAFATGDAPGSLAKVQRDWLVKLRQERGLLAAVREAGPFAMVAMTAPSVKSFAANSEKTSSRSMIESDLALAR